MRVRLLTVTVAALLGAGGGCVARPSVPASAPPRDALEPPNAGAAESRATSARHDVEALGGRTQDEPRPATPWPAVRWEQRTDNGGLTASQIDGELTASVDALRECYRLGLARDPALAGTFDIRFVVSRTGYVAASKVTYDTLGSPEVARCTAHEILRMRFPVRDDHEPVSLEVTFEVVPE